MLCHLSIPQHVLSCQGKYREFLECTLVTDGMLFHCWFISYKDRTVFILRNENFTADRILF